jgi:dTDP-4-dehydrorhamnose 3,5-epimerase
MNKELAQYVDIKHFHDNRGYFCETLNLSKPPFNQLKYIQSNMSVNNNGALRGMHYQHKYPQGKFCYVASGAVFDFAIDLRKNSQNFMKCYTFYLEPKGPAVWIPPGYAHGFFSCINNTVFCYHVFGNVWNKDDEHSINPMTVPDIKYMTEVKLDVIVSPKDIAGYDYAASTCPIYE